ncbi:hypothetical protein [Streptomyces sp. NPDC002187]|uniref:hypothetical protein n=1 Tax=Streptomyces sp. NPDC002187 TaxID=3364637 RepID=UPI0036A0BCC1
MARVSRGLVHAVAWSLSTGAAVTLSWWGVHTVMAGTAYDRPRALPITAQSSTTQAVGPQESSTRRPPSPSPTKSPEPTKRPAGKPSGGTSPTTSPSPSDTGSSDGYGDPGTVKSHTVTGGMAVFDVGKTSAELVSATPSAGWQMQVWTQPTWIRVTFTKDGRESSVFYTWNGHPPMAQFDER